MKKFVYLYFGGNPPKSVEEGKAVMQAWMNYFSKMGDKIADGGAPIGPQKICGQPSISSSRWIFHSECRRPRRSCRAHSGSPAHHVGWFNRGV